MIKKIVLFLLVSIWGVVLPIVFAASGLAQALENGIGKLFSPEWLLQPVSFPLWSVLLGSLVIGAIVVIPPVALWRHAKRLSRVEEEQGNLLIGLADAFEEAANDLKKL